MVGRRNVGQPLAGNDVRDPSQVAPLLDQIEASIASITADGAYGGMPTYDIVDGYGEDICVIIPPHVTAVPRAEAVHNPSQRDQHILSIAAQGRLGWQKETDYGQRALVETAMGRYKTTIGPCLQAHSFSGQHAEATVGVTVLNRMPDPERPDSVRRLNITAQICWEEGKLHLARSMQQRRADATILFSAQGESSDLYPPIAKHRLSGNRAHALI